MPLSADKKACEQMLKLADRGTFSQNKTVNPRQHSCQGSRKKESSVLHLSLKWLKGGLEGTQ